MRFHLRTLMILLAVGPPMLACLRVATSWLQRDEAGLRLSSWMLDGRTGMLPCRLEQTATLVYGGSSWSFI